MAGSEIDVGKAGSQIGDIEYVSCVALGHHVSSPAGLPRAYCGDVSLAITDIGAGWISRCDDVVVVASERRDLNDLKTLQGRTAGKLRKVLKLVSNSHRRQHRPCGVIRARKCGRLARVRPVTARHVRLEAVAVVSDRTLLHEVGYKPSWASECIGAIRGDAGVA